MSAATITRLVPSSEYGTRTQRVTHVVLHHAATTSLAALERLMEPGGRRVSAHYAVKDKDRVLKVPLANRAFSLSSPAWDSRSVTVECANESTNGWTISDESHESLAVIVADSAKRFGFRPHRDGDPKTWTVIGHREVFTIHGASYATACPGAMDLDRIVRRAQQLLALPTPEPTARKGRTVTLYYCTKTDKPSTTASPQPVEAWACGGDSPGTSANWIVTTDAAFSRALAAQHGAAGNNWVHLTRAAFADMGKRYLEPVRIAGGAAGGGATAAQVADELAKRLVQ